MRKRIIALILTVAMVIPMSVGDSIAAAPFPDIAGHWSENAILSLIERGIVNGYPDGTIRPNSIISRGEFASLAAALMEMRDHTHSGDPTFNDTNESWAHHYIEALVIAGVVETEDEGFRPSEPITRAEMAKMLVYAIGKGEQAIADTNQTLFNDDSDIKPEYKGFINAARLYGLINGRPGNVFNPDDYSTRAEAFTIIHRYDGALEAVAIEEAALSETLETSGDDETESADDSKADNKTSDSSVSDGDSAGVWEPDDNSNSGNNGPWTDSGSGSGGTGSGNSGSQETDSPPVTSPAPGVAAIQFDVNSYGYTDIATAITVITQNAASFSWLIEKVGDGVDTLIWESQTFTGTSTDTLSFLFTDSGKYRISGTAVNSANEGTYASKLIDIYNPQILAMPSQLFTNTVFSIETRLLETSDFIVNWSLMRNGADVTLSDYIDGELTNAGGNIRFTEKGTYILKASVTDITGRTFEHSASVTVYPVSGVSFTLPTTLHTDQTHSITTTLEEMDGLSAEWSLLRGGTDVDITDYLEGTLTNDGGDVRFKQAGDYTLVATVTNSTGREFVTTADVTVYPIPEIVFTLPAALYTDDEYNLSTSLAEMEGLTIVWSLSRDGSNVTPDDYIEGSLSNAGGTIRFKEKGEYILTATATDATGRSFTASDNVSVCPVSEISFILPATLHTDTTHSLAVTLSDLSGATLLWSLRRNGADVDVGDHIEGTLTNSGGDIRFKNKGEYILSASATDTLGRSYEMSASVTVYPIPEVTFNLPAGLHTDSTHNLTTTLTEMDGLSIVWGITRNGTEGQLADWVDGTLDNNGGSIRFTETGAYTLTATVTDDTGREFTVSADTVIYPVPSIAFTLPDTLHTDGIWQLITALDNMGTLDIVWSLERNGSQVMMDSYVEGSLTNNGGDIRFKQDGAYTLTAAVTDSTGRKIEVSDSVTVYPVAEITFTLPAMTHTDITHNMTTTLTGMDGLTIVWSLTYEGAAVTLGEHLEGTLDNNGGDIRFKQAGEYTLTAKATDNAGRVFETAVSVAVYPVIDIDFTLPDTIHTDDNYEVIVTNP